MDRTNKIITIAAIVTLIMGLSALPIAGQSPVEPPVDFTDRAENVGGTGAVSFLFVEGYTPWAAMVVNAGDPDGIDMVTLSFDDETDTLSIELTDSNTTNHATVLVNKAFAEKYIGDDLDFKLSDAVNYKGMEEGNETAENAMYVFQVEHFSTQTIEITKKASFLPHPGVFTVILLISAVAVIVGIKRRY